MKKILPIFALVAFAVACVDNYEDANPPRLLDAPAVSAVESSATYLFGGQSSTITIAVSDAPAGIDSVSVVDTDASGDPAGGTITIVSGLGITSGEVVVEYTAPEKFSSTVTLSISVLDGQVDEKGKNARKSSVAQNIEIQVFCKEPVPGDYRVAMHDSYGDGWQTTSSSGGPGIQVTLNDGTVLEVTLADGYDGEDTITIPSGTISAVWYFPGDRYGEISFEIYSPTDELIFASGAAGETGAGEIPIIDCDE